MTDTAFTISFGDAPKALEEVLDIMRDCGAVLEVEAIQSGQELYRLEIKEGFRPEIFDSLYRTKLLLKAPTSKPREDEYIEVMDAICTKLGITTKIEYFVSDTTPGLGILAENENSPISSITVDDINKAASRFGGYSYGYDIDDLRLIFEKAAGEYPQITTQYQNSEGLKNSYRNFDIIFTTESLAKDLKKAIKPKIGCNIYIGHGYAFFEPMEDYNKNNKGLLLAAALMIKYSGQSEAAWAIYEKLQ